LYTLRVMSGVFPLYWNESNHDKSAQELCFIFSKDFSREKKSTSLEQFDIQPIGSKPRF